MLIFSLNRVLKKAAKQLKKKYGTQQINPTTLNIKRDEMFRSW